MRVFLCYGEVRKESRLKRALRANHHIKYLLAWDRLVSNTKRRRRRRVCRGRGKTVEGVATLGKVWGNGRGWDWSHMQGLGVS